AEDGIRDFHVTGVQTCALPIFFQAMFEAPIRTVIEGARANYFVAMARWKETHDGSTTAARRQIQEEAAAYLMDAADAIDNMSERSEERRVGKERSSRGGTETSK